MPARGDFAALRRHIESLRDEYARREKLAAHAQEQLQERVAEAFLFQRTPAGQAWAPRKHVYGDSRDSNPLLYDILSSIRCARKITSTGFVVKGETEKYYLEYHVTGTVHMVARRPIPLTLRELFGNSKPRLY